MKRIVCPSTSSCQPNLFDKIVVAKRRGRITAKIFGGRILIYIYMDRFAELFGKFLMTITLNTVSEINI